MFSLMNPDTGQTYALRNAGRAFAGKAPTLREANMAFGPGTAEAWLYGQIVNLSEYCGSRDKITVKQAQSLSQVMASGYSHLKMSELLLFFGRFKAGFYGQFYGGVDPVTITNALRSFMAARDRVLDRLANEENARREAEEAKKPTCTYQEYLAMKAAREGGQEQSGKTN